MSDFTICQISPDFRCQQISADQTQIQVHSPFSFLVPSPCPHDAGNILSPVSSCHSLSFTSFMQILHVSPRGAFSWLAQHWLTCHLSKLLFSASPSFCFLLLLLFRPHTTVKFSMCHSSFQPIGPTMYSPIYIYWPNIKLHHLSRWQLETLPSLVSVTFHQLMVQIQITTDMYFETRCHSGMFGSEQVHCWGSGRPPDWGWDVGGALRAVGGVYAPPYSLLLHPAHLNIGACSRHDSYRGGSYLTLESQDYLKHLNSVCKLFRWDGLMAIHWGQTYPPTSRFPSGFALEKSFDCWGCSTLFSVSSHIQFPCLH